MQSWVSYKSVHLYDIEFDLWNVERVQGAYLWKVYNYHNSRACGYKRSEILFWLDGMDVNVIILV
jgi:hypothetical protein